MRLTRFFYPVNNQKKTLHITPSEFDNEKECSWDDLNDPPHGMEEEEQK